MRITRRLPIIAACLLGGAFISTQASADVARSTLLASTCFACHGTDGKSPGAIPSIYGFPAQVMEMQLRTFRDGTRAATVMDRHAKGYTDEEISLIADYLSKIQ
jgi:sulfide dehydrogenase cytochrome subunit